MNILVISSSPNPDGLSAACAENAQQGIEEAGGRAKIVSLNDLKIGNCQACERGWGTCQEEHRCQVEDDFQALHTDLCQADGLVLVTPVYWGEMSESAKAFTDRVRRCEATLDQQSHLFQKPVIAVAAAGGSGNGTITCLASIERWIQHVRAWPFDLIPINRWTRSYKLSSVYNAGLAIVQKGRFEDR